MKITKQQALDLSNALHSVGNLTGVRFAYAVSKNIQRLRPVIESLQETFKPSDEYNAYQDARIKLAENSAKKVNGIPQKKQKNGVERYVMENEKDFEAKFKELQKEHKECIDIREKQEKDFKATLKEKVEVDLYLVSIDHLPTNISAKQMSDIFLIVTEQKKIQTYSDMDRQVH